MAEDVGIRFVGITLQEALDLAYASDTELSTLYIEPPDSHVLTDEDSGEEDEGGLADNLSSRQLTAGAEICFANSTRIGGIENEIEHDDVSTSTDSIDYNVERGLPTQHLSKKCLNIEKSPSNWEFFHGDLEQQTNYIFPKGDYSIYKTKSHVELFELFFSNDLLQLLVERTSEYALFKNCPDPKVSIDEMKVALGILILSGYNEVPSKRNYWEASKDMRNELVYEAMRRDRFLQISRFLHFADNTAIDINDKLFKLRPLSDYLKNKFIEHFVPEQNLSYDESMIRYYGRHGCKQFIRGKPIRFGYKVWCLNTASGYLVNFEIYQGKNPRANNTYEKLVGKAYAPLLQMIEDLGAKGSLSYKFYFDNLFTGVNLLSILKNNGYNGTGTVRDNRIPKPCPILSKKVMLKKPRGSYSTTLERNSGIKYIRWMDNSVVTILSTVFGVEPLKTVERFCRRDRKRVPVARPHAFLEYNKNMGGTDLMDESISNYRVGVRAKKWYWPIFTYLLDASIHNGWHLCKMSGRPVSQLEFRRSIAQAYLTTYKIPPKSVGRVSQSRRDQRLDNFGHFVITIPNNKRRRCAGINCSSKGRTMCDKCDVGLCIGCFKNFHTKK